MQKQYRLKNSNEIGSVVSRRKAARGKYYTIYYQLDKKFSVAFSASKKYGNAVERNRAKRIMREIVRSFIDVLNNYKIVIVVKKEGKDVPFLILKKDLEYQISYILKKGEKNEEK